MKSKKSVFLLLIITVVAVLMCSCSRDTMRKGTQLKNDAKRGIDNAIRNGENVVDYGMGALDYGMGTSDTGYTRGGMGMNDGYGTYGANSGYNAYAGTGTTAAGTGTRTAVTGRDNGMELFPTLKDTSRDNMGQINTTNGKSDGGKGDMYDDMNMNRNSLRTDKLNKKYVKK